MNSRKYFSVENLICYFLTTLLIGSVILVIVIVTLPTQQYDNQRSIWTYECESNKCVKRLITNDTSELNSSFMKCRQYCLTDVKTSNIWPMVSSITNLNQNYIPIKINGWQFLNNNSKNRNFLFWQNNEERFSKQIHAKIPKTIKLPINNDNGYNIEININVTVDAGELIKLTTDTDESYRIESVALINTKIIEIKIISNTIFGARHALESLVQLIYFDDITIELFIRTDFILEDRPAFKHRGISLDTSRNYYSVDSIKRTIDAMSMVKLNVFHWHITDSHSFPMVIKSHPDLSKYGAYSDTMIYTAKDVQELVAHAHNRGVRIIPEFDAPAHVGEGWVHSSDYVNLTTCYAYQPWTQYCYEPPCGQFNPSVPKLYDILENIYGEMIEMFNDPDVFHMGGDEISLNCWRSSENLTEWMLANDYDVNDDNSYIQLWDYFQSNAANRLNAVSSANIKIILWTSTLTEHPNVEEYLDKNKYIIQAWGTRNDSDVPILLEKGYNVIISNHDILYLDCGFGSWTGTGNNWCSPYTGWELIYNNDFTIFDEQYLSQILGSEAALWSEQSDGYTVDAKLWPRGIALAERLWTNPVLSYRDAEPRILIQRERFIENGIAAENIQPRWCLQNEGECPY